MSAGVWKILLPLTFLLGGACSGGEDGADGDPYVAFITPTDGETLCGEAIAIDLDVRNYELTSVVETDPDKVPAGIGHAHIYLNGQYVYEGDSPTFTLDQPVDDGAWQLKVELANENHSAVVPYTYDLIYITVDNTLCDGGDT